MGTVNKDTLCPSCGFDFFREFGFKPWNGESPSDEICPSCGIQFGYTDMAGGDKKKRQEIYKQWRKEWIRNGMLWDKGNSKPPENWDPEEQIKRIKDN